MAFRNPCFYSLGRFGTNVGGYLLSIYDPGLRHVFGRLHHWSEGAFLEAQSYGLQSST